MAGKKRITQETFDDAVKENMDDFGMSREEAIKDSIEQFEMQVGSHSHHHVLPGDSRAKHCVTVLRRVG